MRINTVAFISVNDLFMGLPDLKQAFDCYDHANMTWGTSSHSLVRPDKILDEWLMPFEDSDYSTDLAYECSELKARLNNMPEGVFIDLEN